MARNLLLSLCIGLLLSCSAENPAVEESVDVATPTESDRLNTWFGEKNEERLAFSPMELTTLNRKDFYDQLDQLTDSSKFIGRCPEQVD